MPAVATEQWGQKLSRDQGVRVYLVTGAADIGEAYTTARTAAGTTWMGLKQYDADPEEKYTGRGIVYFVTVKFGNPDSAGGQGRVVGDSTYEFDTTGGTTHITHAKEHVQTYGLLGTVPTHNPSGLINIDKLQVKGVDIVIPKFSFSETHILSNATVDATYKGTVYRLTGKVNDATFKGTNASESLFLGARGSKRPQGDWEINFMFAASANKTGIEVGAITGIAVEGWDYLWVEFQPEENGATKRLEQVALYANVERVYDPEDFSDLGIGT